MKKTCNGFTLSELLIVLAIIGVVAILTIPALTKNINKQKIGPMLGKSVEQIELGCQNLIQAYNDSVTDGSYADRLSALSGDYAFSFATLSPFIGTRYKNPTPVAQPGMHIQPAQFGIYEFQKFPATIMVANNAVNIPANALEDSVIIEEFTVDVNGYNNEPNEDGKDRFYFSLLNNGKLRPLGYNNYKNSCADGNITNAKECTARVIADGYKVTYDLK